MRGAWVVLCDGVGLVEGDLPVLERWELAERVLALVVRWHRVLLKDVDL